jgi:hypothetical protein
MHEAAEPIDSHDAVFLRRAIDQIGRAKYPRDWSGRETESEADESSTLRLKELHIAVAQAIVAGKLKMRARLVEAREGILGVLGPRTLTVERWLEVMKSSQIELLDMRPWVSARARRRIPLPHWLFVTRESLDKFIRQFQHLTVREERRAVAALAEKLRTDPNLKKSDDVTSSRKRRLR